ncbi:MAG: hypothetical protein ACI4U3_05805, partial [Traorella sp.]
KPIMESEEFVANEYVGACWYVACDCDGNGIYENQILVKGDTIDEALYSYNKLVYLAEDSDGTDIIIGGNIGNCAGITNQACEHTKRKIDLNCNGNDACSFIEWLINRIIDRYNPNNDLHHHAQITQKGISDGPNAS